MEGVIHVLVVDDRILVGELLVHRLNRESWLTAEAVHSTDDGIQQARDQQPAAVLLHTDASGTSPFAAAANISIVSPRSRILFMAQVVRDSEIEQALRVGAHAYLTERQPVGDLLTAIRSVMAGETWFAPEVHARIPGDATRLLAADAYTLLSTLSDREREVLIYTASGLSAKEVARLMHLSSRTVESHTARLMRKLALRDRVALTRYAIREGLVSP